MSLDFNKYSIDIHKLEMLKQENNHLRNRLVLCWSLTNEISKNAKGIRKKIKDRKN
jgi:hypothetical protein